jgi:hypothetical protein
VLTPGAFHVAAATRTPSRLLAVWERPARGLSVVSVTDHFFERPLMTTTSPPTPPPVQVPIEVPRRKPRALPVTVGAVLATFGSVVALAGGGVLAVAGDDGTIGSGNHDVSTPTAALVSDTAKFEDTNDVASVLGQPEIGVTATAHEGGPDKFVGIGPKADVDRYLAGVEVDRVTDFEVDPFKLDKQREQGTAAAAAPTSQSFWVAQSSGQRADVNWKVRDGSYRVVVMNADGSPGMSTESHFEAGLPYLSTAALATMLAGLMAIGGGVVLIARNASVRVN